MIEECGARGMTAVQHSGVILEPPGLSKLREKENEGKLNWENDKNNGKERRDITCSKRTDSRDRVRRSSRVNFFQDDPYI